MIAPGTLLFHDARQPDGPSRLFRAPREILVAETADAARAALVRLEAARRDGLWAAGYCAYELGYLFEERLRDRLAAPTGTPLLWFGLYDRVETLDRAGAADFLAQAAGAAPARVADLALSRDFASYRQAFETVQGYIAAGDIYQANLTLRARFRLEGDPAALYRDLALRQPVAYGALLQAGTTSVLSLSPELFLRRQGAHLETRPMKGTIARGRTPEEDAAMRARLAADPKNRAENLMIVDLLRNDLGRIARTGSVEVTDLFSVETYRSLHQMTSGIAAELAEPDLPFGEILASLFPCGSITGAPKLRAMEILHAVEEGPRGLYTGAIGFVAPDGDFCFSVAIRTAVIDADGNGTIGIGGGIVADSTGEAEYAEARLKLAFLADAEPPPGLIETLLWRPGDGYWLLDRHLERLAGSAHYFGYDLPPGAARSALEAAAMAFAAPMRVRLLLDPATGLSVTAVPLPAPGPFRFALADEAMDSADRFLFHKTTRRARYDAAREAARAELGVDEVVFRNERGELTEGSITSLFVVIGGQMLTPPLSAGLLPGTLRAELLSNGSAREAVLRPEDLGRAEGIFLGNSVRGLLPAAFVRPDG